MGIVNVEIPVTLTRMVLFFSIGLGAIIGSFLNCLIYRLPRHVSLTQPARSFCPHCQHTLAWFENIPLLSWLFLKGRCRACHAPISLRYPLVEMLTALLFGLCYERFGFPMTIGTWIFVALLIAATFIDLEHLIIPDEITLGGIALGLGSSFFLPEMMGTSTRLLAFSYSLESALIAASLLWVILELGKKVFGNKKLRWDVPHSLSLLKKEEHFFLCLEDEELPLEEFFSRASDRIVAHVTHFEVAQKKIASSSFTITPDAISIPGCSWKWEEALPLHAQITQLSLPREAMGFGDVKFLACIAAFLGVKGMLCALFGGSIIGAAVGCLLLLVTRGRHGRMLPFGPYLALGSFLWMFLGKSIFTF